MAGTLGALLVLAGLLLLVPLLIIMLIVVLVAVFTGDAAAPDADSVIVVVLAAGGGILWVAGVKLLRGRPRTVLFLRKFGFDDAKAFVSHAAGDALGRRWRLVTLDDLATQPVGTKKGTRWTARIVVIVAAVGLIWALLMAVQAFSDPFAGSDQAAQNADGPLEQIGAEIGALFAAAILFLFLIAIISLIAGVAGALGIAGLLTSRSLRRAERDQWTRVRSRVELTEFLDNVRRTQSKLFAPRIAVLRTVDELWRDAVAGLADIADVALIDISDPSEALLWELQMLDRRPDVEVVLIGEASRVEALHRTGGHDADDRAVIALLGQRPVLTYSRDRKRFAAELHNMLEVAIRRRRGQ